MVPQIAMMQVSTNHVLYAHKKWLGKIHFRKMEKVT